MTISYAEIQNVLIKKDVEVWSKRGYNQRLYGQRLTTDIFTIDVNKLVVSDKVLCNNGKDCRYTVGYQTDGTLIPLFIKTPKNVFSFGVSQYDKNSAYTMSFNVFEEKE